MPIFEKDAGDCQAEVNVVDMQPNNGMIVNLISGEKADYGDSVIKHGEGDLD